MNPARRYLNLAFLSKDVSDVAVRPTAAESDWTSRAKDEEAEHEAIVGALESRDAAALAEALRRHIYRAKGSLVGALKIRGK